MLLNKEDIKKIISDNNKSNPLIIDMSEEAINRVFERINKRLNEMSLEGLIALCNKKNNFKLRNFAPGLYFIPNDVTRFSCQI